MILAFFFAFQVKLCLDHNLEKPWYICYKRWFHMFIVRAGQINVLVWLILHWKRTSKNGEITFGCKTHIIYRNFFLIIEKSFLKLQQIPINSTGFFEDIILMVNLKIILTLT